MPDTAPHPTHPDASRGRTPHPDGLLTLAADAHEQWHIDNRTSDYFEVYRSSHEAWVRATLAAVLPAHERQVREQVARDIEANPSGECSGAVAECARIARGTDPADPPDPRLSELTTRAAAIDLPSEEPDITDALRRIRRDIRLALTSRYDPHANPAADLERELGNMIVSSLRWMRVYGLDPLTCIETAERVQRERAEREGR